MLQDIKETLDYIYSFVNLESNISAKYLNNEYSLENIHNILKYFNNPHENKKIIHIAGTKGKGSTSLMITKLLVKLGFNVATFVSPHLVRPNERILYNLNEIADKELIEITNNIKEIIDENSLKPTTFEIFFLIYLLFSVNKNSDYLVIEVGLGGRLDCTNVVNPLVSVITSIGFDHTNILGDTITKIASEKAGIIKSDSKVVVGNQYYSCRTIFKKIAKEKKSIYFDIKKHFRITNILPKENGIIFDFYLKDEKRRISNFYLPLYGIHQIYNFLTAFYTVYIVDKNIVNILNDEKKVDIELNGRIKLINNDLPIIVDVSHNKESVKELVKTLHLHFKNKKWNILLGLAYDKDIAKYVKELRKIARKIAITTLSQYKKSNPKEVFEITKKYFKNCEIILEQKEAFKKILQEKENILVTGSFYITGPFIEFYLSKK